MSTKKTPYKKEVGASGFSSEYWEVNYSEPEEMDNVFNASEHARYLKALFDLEMVDVSSIIDLGFGPGHLFSAMMKEFNPYRACGIEPSKHIFDQVNHKTLKPTESTKLTLYNIDLLTWAKKDLKRDRTFDLGICTSVFQYLSDDEINEILPVMAERIRFIYFSVPTDLELKRQIEDVEFHDQYAIHRSKERYLKLIKPHFTIISSRLLESKFHFDEDSTNFTDLLFRF
jgi:hypothetical protein